MKSRLVTTLTVALSTLTAVAVNADVVTDQLVFNYDGDSQTASTWTSSSPGSNTSRVWTASGSVSLGASGSALTNITTAYDLDGGGFTGTAFNGLGTNGSFEVWIKPDSLTGGKQVIFETGGSSQGLSITLWNNVLKFAVKNDSTHLAPPAANIIERTLTTADIADFMQVVVTVPSSGSVVMYVNPVSSADPSIAAGTGNRANFAGSEDAGLGMLGNNLGGGSSTGAVTDWHTNQFIPFDGKIGLFRVYNDVLTSSEVADNFYAVVIPEPASLALFALGVSMICVRRGA
jgi:hypothetical protein